MKLALFLLALSVTAAPVLLKGGLVFDGTGTPARRADVLMDNGKVEAVGLNLQTPAGTTTVNLQVDIIKRRGVAAH